MNRVMTLGDRGFSLIELLVAAVMFAIGVAALVVFLTGSMAANNSSHNQSTATQLAQDRLEELRSRSFGAVTSGNDAQPLNATGGTANGVFTRSWTVDMATIPPAKQVTVTVSWQDHGARQVQLATVIAP